MNGKCLDEQKHEEDWTLLKAYGVLLQTTHIKPTKTHRGIKEVKQQRNAKKKASKTRRLLHEEIST